MDIRSAQVAGGVELKGDSALPALNPGRMPGVAHQVPSVTAAQMAEVDRRVVRDYRIGLVQMMELAGRGLAEQARAMLGGSVVGRKIIVLCGMGNNGGGGMVAARHLHGWEAQVDAVLIGPMAMLKRSPKRQWTILKRLGLAASARIDPALGRPDLIIDAIFGYGFHGRPRAHAVRWIKWANDQGCRILALDVPSGLDATTGDPSIACVRATVTLTLALPKTGLRAPEAAVNVGEIYLADIGVPPEVFRDIGLEVGHLFETGSIVRAPG